MVKEKTSPQIKTFFLSDLPLRYLNLEIKIIVEDFSGFSKSFLPWSDEYSWDTYFNSSKEKPGGM